MWKAIIYNPIKGTSVEMTATQYEETYIGNKRLKVFPTHPEDAKDVIAISPENGYVLGFQGRYPKKGGSEVCAASFTRPNGYGNNSHIFNRTAKLSLEDEVKAGKHVLLSLNMDLTPQPMPFDGVQEKGVLPLIKWIEKNRADYVSVSIRSADEALKTIKKIHEAAPQFPINDQISVLYRGTVMPYRNFYLGHKPRYLLKLYKNMEEGTSGIKIGNERMLGLPRLLRIEPTKKTMRDNGASRLKGNLIPLVDDGIQFSELVFTHQDDALKTGPYVALEKAFLAKEGVYVLACPSITLFDAETAPKADDKVKQMLRWVISDIENQYAPVSKEGKQRLTHRRKFSSNEAPLVEAPEVGL